MPLEVLAFKIELDRLRLEAGRARGNAYRERS